MGYYPACLHPLFLTSLQVVSGASREWPSHAGGPGSWWLSDSQRREFGGPGSCWWQVYWNLLSVRMPSPQSNVPGVSPLILVILYDKDKLPEQGGDL